MELMVDNPERSDAGTVTTEVPYPIIGSDGISVILPVFNHAEGIGRTVAALRQEVRPLVAQLEFIIVDDGSTDGTAAAATRLCEMATDVRLLRNRGNLGKGLAVYLGLLAARYSKVCFTDADLPFSSGSYARVLQRLLLGCPFVAASRRMRDSEILVRMEVLGYAARRHLVGVTFNYIVRKFVGLPYRDTQCGLKGFDRQVGIQLLQRIRSSRFLFDIELFLAAQAVGIPVEEVPVCMVYNDFKSSVRLVADSTRMLLGLSAICACHCLSRYCSPNPAMAPDTIRNWAQEVSPSALRDVSPEGTEVGG
jgi:dolichyl-phosphate beta-glucosyltransferase